MEWRTKKTIGAIRKCLHSGHVPLHILQEGDEPAYVRIDHNEALIVDAPKDSKIIVNYVIIMQTLYQ